ncbi:MAG: hypothetical protein HY709_12155 [Candidatus Latescibacteria bacterium]|nr:hypothetical protein [Candidatus Latescibacterota bacterium]
MQSDTIRSDAHHLLDQLSEAKLMEAVNYLTLLDHLPDAQLDAIDDLIESVGWSLLAFEVAEKDWD